LKWFWLTFDTGGEVKNTAHSEPEIRGCQARKSTSPPVSLSMRMLLSNVLS